VSYALQLGECYCILPFTDADVCWIAKKIDIALAAPITSLMNKPSKAKANLLSPAFRLDN